MARDGQPEGRSGLKRLRPWTIAAVLSGLLGKSDGSAGHIPGLTQAIATLPSALRPSCTTSLTSLSRQHGRNTGLAGGSSASCQSLPAAYDPTVFCSRVVPYSFYVPAGFSLGESSPCLSTTTTLGKV
jgi:hypothetical protein